MTVDTSHALLDANTDRQSAYTALTRGRRDNRVYLVTSALAGADGHDETGPARSPAQVLSGIIARDGAALSAITTQEDAYREAHSLARLVPELEDALDRFGKHPTGLEPWHTDPEAPEWISVRDFDGYPEVREWAARQIELIEQRVDHLAELALAGRAEWSRHLGLPNDDVSDEAVVGARIVAAYRDRYGITGIDPLGDAAKPGPQAKDYRRAAACLESMRRALTRNEAPVPSPVGQIHEVRGRRQECSVAERLSQRLHRSANSKDDDGKQRDERKRLTQAREHLRASRKARRESAGPDQYGPRTGLPSVDGPQL